MNTFLEYNLVTTPAYLKQDISWDLQSDMILNVTQLTQTRKYQFRAAVFLKRIWVNSIKWIMLIKTKM